MKFGFISDVHGNLPALKCVLEELAGCRNYCAGDLVGYGPWPNEVISLLNSRRVACVMGNHDYAAVTGDTRGFNLEAEDALLWTKKRLTVENIRFLSSLPMKLSTDVFFMVHGSPRDPLNEYVFPWDPYIERLPSEVMQEVVVLGHTHIPFARKTGESFVLNPGAVGQPRDGNPKASYATYDTEKNKATIKRVDYPIEETAEAIKKAGLPKRLAERLYLGE